jgi:hypothetical protein
MEDVSRAGQDDSLFLDLDALEQQLVTHCALPMTASAETDNMSATAAALSLRESFGRVELSAQQLVAAFRPIRLEAQRIAALLVPLAALLQEIQRGPTIGRKRRARRARGRARQINHTNRFCQ